MALTLAAGLAMALAACTPLPAAPAPAASPGSGAAPPAAAESPPAAAEAPGASRASADQPARGGTLLYALEFEPSLLSPLTGASYDAHLIFRNVYDTLVFLDPSGAFRPALARSWEVSPDGLAVTFRLREGVTFHDGTPFDANAVKFTWDLVADPATRSLLARDLLGPSYLGVDVVDPLTLRVRFSQPYAPFLWAASRHWLAPVSPTAYRTYGADYARHQVGTGPFIWKAYVPRERVVLERNPRYAWAPEGMRHQGPAYLDRIVFTFVPEASVRTGTLQSGEVHLAEALLPRDVAALRGDPSLALYQAQVPGLATVLFLNTRRPPTDSLAVRQALNQAVDKRALVQAMLSGLVEPAQSALAPSTLGYSAASELYRYDPEQARRLLDQAGYRPGPDGIRARDGQRLELDLKTLAFNRYPEIFQVLQAQLRAVGADLKIDVVNYAQFAAAIGRDDYSLVPYFSPSYDPDVLGLHFHSRNVAQGMAYSHLADPQLDRLLDAATGERSQARRLDLYAQAQQTIMQQALVLPLYPVVTNTMARAEVRGLVMDRLGWDPLLYDVYLSR